MNSGHLELYSPLTPEECLRRLREEVYLPMEYSTPPRYWGSSRPVAGGIEGNTFWMHKQAYLSLLAQPSFSGALEPHENGTRIFGSISASTFWRWFLGIWTGAVILGAWLEPMKRNDWLYGIPVMIFTGLLIAALSVAAARREPQYLADFLRSTLDARGETDAP